MDSNKDIGKAFKERLGDFKKLPNDLIWEKLETVLDEDQKKKRFAFWWQYSGFAFGLLLFVGLGYGISPYLVPNISDEVPIKKIVEGNLSEEESKNQDEIKDSVSNRNHITTAPVNESKQTELVKSKSEQKRQEKIDRLKSSSAKINNDVSSQTLDHEEIIAVIPSKRKGNIDGGVIIDTQEKQTTKKSGLDTSKKNKVFIPYLEALSMKIVNVDNVSLESFEFKHVDNYSSREVDMNNSKWLVGIGFAPIFSGSLIKNPLLDPNLNDTNIKSYLTSNSLGIKFGYNLSHKFSIESGINYLQVKSKITKIPALILIYGARLNLLDDEFIEIDTGLSGISPLPIPIGNYDMQQSLTYLEFPLMFSYKVIDGIKWDAMVRLGGSVFHLLNNDLRYNDKSVGYISDINETSYSANVGVGLTYRVVKGLNVNFEPTLKLQQSKYGNKLVDDGSYFLGLYGGLSWQF